MSIYTVKYCDEFMDELLDKMGSDYFPLPIKLNRFRSVVLDFIRETTNFFEGTQELSDDILPIVVSKKHLVSGRTNYMGAKVYKIDLPENYIRLLGITPVSADNEKFFKKSEIKIYRVAHFTTNHRNPFRKAKGGRINVYRMENALIVEVDESVNMKYFSLEYVRMPIFGKNNDEQMIDLPDQTINKLLQKTCVSLRVTSSDQDTGLVDEYVERQGQKNK